MNKLTNWFVRKDAATIFFLSFLGIPLYLWLYSIFTEFEREDLQKNAGRKMLSVIVTLYPIIYFPFSLIFIFYNIIVNDAIGFERILPFHLLAAICSLVLIYLTSGTLTKYEKNKRVESFGSVGNFFLLWFYIFGVWMLQPKINKYSE